MTVHYLDKFSDSVLDFNCGTILQICKLFLPKSLDFFKRKNNLELFNCFEMAFFRVLSCQKLQVSIFNLLEMRIFTVIIEKSCFFIHHYFLFLHNFCNLFLCWFHAELFLYHVKCIFSFNYNWICILFIFKFLDLTVFVFHFYYEIEICFYFCILQNSHNILFVLFCQQFFVGYALFFGFDF